MQYRHSFPVGAIALLCGACCLSLPARSDVTLGGDARLAGMGGAGIALTDQPNKTAPQNPAALALEGRRKSVHLYVPGIGARPDGVAMEDLSDILTDVRDANDAAKLVSRLGKRESVTTVDSSLGVGFSTADVMASAVARVRLEPNIPLKEWANTANGDVDQLPSGARGDLFGAAVYNLPSIAAAHGFTLPQDGTRVEVGVRVNLARGMYTHYRVNATAIENAANNETTPESELLAREMQGKSYLDKTGVGVDLGVIVHSPKVPGLSGGLVVTNLINPNLKFDGTDRRDLPKRFDLSPTNVALGVAFRKDAGTVVADAVRVHNDYQVRVGGEYVTEKGFAVRAGYSSAHGFTAGVGYGAFDVAIGTRLPLGISRTFRF